MGYGKRIEKSLEYHAKLVALLEGELFAAQTKHREAMERRAGQLTEANFEGAVAADRDLIDARLAMEEAANRLKVAHEMPALTREVFDAEWRETRAPLLDRRDDLTASVDKALEKYLKTLVELSEHTQIISTRAGEYADLASQHFTEPPIGWYRLFGFTGDIAQHPRELYAQRANKIDEFMRTNAKK